MKTPTSIILTLIFVVSFLSAQNVITVDRNPGAVAMFTNMTDAYAAAVDGDTILVAGSATIYGSLDCYKELHFIGNGYMLGSTGNDIPGVNRNATTLNIDFKENVSQGFGDSSNSSVTGMAGGFGSDAMVTGVVVDKCLNVTNQNWIFDGTVTITRCYFRNNLIRLNASGSSISNSRVSNLELKQANTSADHCIIGSTIQTVVGSSVSNTIFWFDKTSDMDADGNFTYCVNIGPAGIVPAGIGNDTGVHLLSEFFVNPSEDPTIDNYYMLKEGSPGSGTGQGGADMGIFGGSKPYVLSGVPGIPRMTEFSVPAIATGLSALEFEFSAQSFSE